MNFNKVIFKKTVTIGNNSTDAVIEVNDGYNIKNQPFRRVNFVNTSPENSFNAAKLFELFEIDFEQLKRVLNDDGFFYN